MASYFDGRFTMPMRNWIQKITQHKDKKSQIKMATLLMKDKYEIKLSLTEIIQSTISNSDVHDNIMTAKTHLERVESIGSIFPLDEFLKLISPLDIMLAKDKVLAKILKKNGDKLQKNDDIPGAIRSYNLASCFAPDEHKITGEIYWKKSTIMLTTNNFYACINDIEATEKHYSYKNLKDKILKRREKCNYLIEIYKKGIPKNTDNVNYMNDVLFKLHGECKPDMLPMGNYISIKSNEEEGRHAILDIKLPTGTTVIVEDPFVSILINKLSFNIKHCAKCFKKIKSSIACPNCVLNTYCCMDCQKIDFEDGHKYECPCVPYLYAINIERNIHMSLVAICKAGPEIIYKHYIKSMKTTTNIQKNEMDNNMNSSNNIIEDDKEKSRLYSNVLSMAGHIYENEMPHLTWMAMSIAHVLAKKSTFCNEINDSEKIGFIYFIASMMLTHIVSFPVNTTAIYEKKKTRRPLRVFIRRCHKQEYTHIASGIYPITNILNHSCDPTVFREQLPNGKITIITNRSMNPGDQLLLSYGCVFSSTSQNARQSHLMGNFNFKCKCIACTKGWPLLKDMNKDELKILCPHCPTKDHSSNKIKKYLPILIPISKYGMCNNCKSMYEMDNIKKQIESYEIKLEQADVLVYKRNPIQAIPLLIECITFFQKTLSPPSVQVIIGHELLDQAYNMITFS